MNKRIRIHRYPDISSRVPLLEESNPRLWRQVQGVSAKLTNDELGAFLRRIGSTTSKTASSDRDELLNVLAEINEAQAHTLLRQYRDR